MKCLRKRWLSAVVIILVINKNSTIVSSNLIFLSDDNDTLSSFTLPRKYNNYSPSTEDTSYNVCSCKPKSACTTDNFWNIINIRIVTPPAGTECQPGHVYCCGAQSNCGINRIIPVPDMPIKSGQADFGEFPWQVLIITLGNEYVGSGALISTSHIITAAHRLTYFTKKGQRLFVRLGDWDVENIKEPYPLVDVVVNQITIHPQYDSRSLQYNVAILSLAQPVAIAPNINTVCLPAQSSCFTGKTCWVSGWGKDMFGPNGNYQSVQKKVDVRILDPNECEERLRNTKLGPSFHFDQQSFLCAGGVKGKDACTQGDGGAPLVCQSDDGHWTLAGLVAWGLGCAQQDVPGVYVNIPNMATWIQQQIQLPLVFDKNIR